MYRQFILPTIVAMALAPAAARADILYGISNNFGGFGATLIRIDTDAETVTSLGSTNGNNQAPSFEINLTGSTGWMPESNGNLFSYDFATDSFTNEGAISFPANTSTLTALEYIGGALYASAIGVEDRENSGVLCVLNPTTRVATPIGQQVGMTAPTSGLAWDGNTSTFYAISSAEQDSKIYTIDASTGAATYVADITLGGLNVRNISAIVIQDGTAWVTGNQNINGLNREALYTLNMTTGVLTLAFDMQVRLQSLSQGPPPEIKITDTSFNPGGDLVLTVDIETTDLMVQEAPSPGGTFNYLFLPPANIGTNTFTIPAATVSSLQGARSSHFFRVAYLLQVPD